MTIQIPMLVSFRVLRASMSSDIGVRDGLLSAISSLSLVLRAKHDTKIHLSGGEPLSKVEVHFSISPKWRTPAELDRDLTANDVGFLCHTREPNGKAFVHGAAVWPNEVLPQYLLEEDLTRNALITISSLPTILDSAAPHSWGTNREHTLRLSAVCFNAFQEEG